ncbi:MAG: HAD family hydrolase [Lachnotalea sp.]
MIKGILFDKDGTLIEFNQYWHFILQGLFEKLEKEYQISKNTITELKTVSGFQKKGFEKESIIQYLATSDIMSLWHKIIIKNENNTPVFYSENKLTELLDEQALDQNVKVEALDGVTQLLKYLKEKEYYLGVATADTRKSTDDSLNKAGLYEKFDYIGCDEKGLQPKPSAQLAVLFCDKVNIRMDQVLIVGDSVTDMLFAENAGAEFVGIRTEYNQYQEFEKKNKKMVEHIIDIIETCGL